MSNSSDVEAFEQLVERAGACRLCARMEGRTRVLGAGNGRPGAQILFVAEALGRWGADRSGIPLSGDQTGRNFEALLSVGGISRDAVFITNAVLCNPRDRYGRNDVPTTRELHNCAAHLRETIVVIRPRYVVALGRTALRALHLIAPHAVVLPRDVGHPIPWNGGLLIPFYHPGPRARVHRPLNLQYEDFRRLGDLVRKEGVASDEPLS